MHTVYTSRIKGALAFLPLLNTLTLRLRTQHFSYLLIRFSTLSVYERNKTLETAAIRSPEDKIIMRAAYSLPNTIRTLFTRLETLSRMKSA